jgi:tetratricopeptide (TPR) repeat protein
VASTIGVSAIAVVALAVPGVAVSAPAASTTAAASSAGGATPFRPTDPGFVVAELPGGSRARDGFARQLELSRSDPQLAAQLAAALLEQARISAQPQLYGRAESVLAPWIARPVVPAPLLILEANILQQRHEFAAAIELADRAIAQDPRSGQAHLMRANVHIVTGDYERARPDCAWLLGSGEQWTGSVCIAQVLGSTGQLQRARALLERLMAGDAAGHSDQGQFDQRQFGQVATGRGRTDESRTAQCPSAQGPSAQGPRAQGPGAQCPSAQCPSAQCPSAQGPSAQCPSAQCPSAQGPSAQCPSAQGPTRQLPNGQAPNGQGPSVGILSWTLSVRADLALRAGALPEAQDMLWRAVALAPASDYARLALADVLMARNQFAQAVVVLDTTRPSVGVLLRRAIAQSRTHDAHTQDSLAELKERLTVSAQRGERTHLREETRLAQEFPQGGADDRQAALVLARDNFNVQRETEDIRLFARAAAAARDPAALATLEEWLRRSHYEDIVVDQLLRSVRSS